MTVRMLNNFGSKRDVSIHIIDYINEILFSCGCRISGRGECLSIIRPTFAELSIIILKWNHGMKIHGALTFALVFIFVFQTLFHSSDLRLGLVNEFWNCEAKFHLERSRLQRLQENPAITKWFLCIKIIDCSRQLGVSISFSIFAGYERDQVSYWGVSADIHGALVMYSSGNITRWRKINQFWLI